MKILISDHAGHPFQAQHSGALAGRDQIIPRAYCGKLQMPRSELAHKPEDLPGFGIEAIEPGKPLNRYGLLSCQHLRMEIAGLLAPCVPSSATDADISS